MMTGKALHMMIPIILFASNSGQAQNYIHDLKAETNDRGIQILITANSPIEYEILPFSERRYTLIRLHPLRFENDKRDTMLSSLQNLNLKVKAFELLDNTLMLAFRDVVSDDVEVVEKDESKSVGIRVRSTNPVGSQISSQKKVTPQYYEMAEELYQKNQLPDAISAVRNAIKEKQNVAGAYFLAGKIRLALQEWQSARINFRKSLQMAPGNQEAEMYLAKIDSMKSAASGIQTATVETKNPNTAEPSEVAATEDRDTTNVSEVPAVVISPSLEPDNKPPSQDTTEAIFPTSLSSLQRKSEVISKSYLQFGFFVVLIGSFFAWIFYLWNRRHVLVSAKMEPPKPDFSSVLKQTQRHIDRPRHEIHRGETEAKTDQREKAKKAHAVTRTNDDRRPLRTVEPRREFQPISFEGDSRETVRRYASSGYSIEEIARRLGIGKGEVELILNLEGRKSPMAPPEFRFELAESLY